VEWRSHAEFNWTTPTCIKYQIHTQCMIQEKGTVMQETATGSSLYEEE
jgi:hypothetical protein